MENHLPISIDSYRAYIDEANLTNGTSHLYSQEGYFLMNISYIIWIMFLLMIIIFVLKTFNNFIRSLNRLFH